MCIEIEPTIHGIIAAVRVGPLLFSILVLVLMVIVIAGAVRKLQVLIDQLCSCRTKNFIAICKKALRFMSWGVCKAIVDTLRTGSNTDFFATCKKASKYCWWEVSPK